MTTETTISISLIFALIAMISTIFSIVNTLKSNSDKELKQKLEIEKQYVGLNVKLDDMSVNMSQLINKNEKSILEIQEINKKLIIQNEKIEYLYKDNEDFEKRLKLVEIERRN